MVSKENGQNRPLAHSTAKTILKSLWTAYNNCTLYSPHHPLAEKTVADFYNRLLEILPAISPLTIHLEEESLFCESWKIEKKGFAFRLITRFKDSGVQSVAFEQGLDHEALKLFFAMLNEPGKYDTVEKMKNAFVENDMGGIELNFITFQKVKSDEIVVSENFGEFIRNLAGGDGVMQSDRNIQKLRARIKNEGAASLVSYLMKIKNRIPVDTHNYKNLPPLYDVIDTLKVLKKGFIEDLQVDTAHAVIDQAAETAVTEPDTLANEIMIKIISEEYTAGVRSPGDLALLIKRLIPDTITMKRLLPHIKQALLARGMSLPEYLEMVRCLISELEGSSLITLLKETGEAIGVSVDEIVKDLKKNPQAAARLIVLASEIKNHLSGTDEEFIANISNYIERIGMKMIKDDIEQNSETERQDIEETLSAIENDLLKTFGPGDIRPVPIDLIQRNLRIRLSAAVQRLKEETAQIKADRVTEASNTPAVSKSKSKKKAATRKVPSLPKEILRKKDTRRILQREIQRNCRYKTPFACLSLSLDYDTCNDSPSNEMLKLIFTEIYRILAENVRDLDVIGSPGSLADNYIMVILPETSQKGANILKNRLEQKCSAITIDYRGKRIVPRITISTISYDEEHKPHMPAFLRQVKAHHKKTAAISQ